MEHSGQYDLPFCEYSQYFSIKPFSRERVKGKDLLTTVAFSSFLRRTVYRRTQANIAASEESEKAYQLLYIGKFPSDAPSHPCLPFFLGHVCHM